MDRFLLICPEGGVRKMSSLERENAELMGISVQWWALGLGLVVATAFAIAYTNPHLMNLDYKATRNSDSYVTTQQTALVSLKSQYEQVGVNILKYEPNPANKKLVEGMGGQQKVLIREMKQIAVKIPGKVPEDIQKFLDEHK